MSGRSLSLARLALLAVLLPGPLGSLRAASASHMDDAIGRVLSALERKNVRQNARILFLSDNGAHRPGPNQGGPYPGDYGTLKVGNNNLPWRGHKSPRCWPG